MAKAKPSKVKVISLGMVILLIQLWMFVNVDILFPESTQAWTRVILVYLVLQATVFSVPDLRSKLFRYEFKKHFLKIILWLFVSSAFFSVISGFLISPKYMQGLKITGVALSVLLIHGFYVSVIEELFFRDWLESKLGIWKANAVFAVFHWSVYYSNIIAMFFAFLLGIGLSIVRRKFTPQSNTANIGCHWGYNSFVLGLFRGMVQ